MIERDDRERDREIDRDREREVCLCGDFSVFVWSPTANGKEEKGEGKKGGKGG